MRRSLSLSVLAFALLAGCAAPTPAAPEPSTAAAVPAPAAAPSSGMTLRVPDLDIDTPLVDLSFDDNGKVEVPPATEPHTAGWYTPSPVPGDVGPAVLLGHVSGRPPGADRSVPGVFAFLHKLTAGDRIEVTRPDGGVAVFRVTSVGRYSKEQFPTARVYGDTDGPELRLVTCGGVFDERSGHYADNVIAFAVAA